MEDMHDDITRIHQHPFTLRLTFHGQNVKALFLECVDDVVGERGYMFLGAAGGYDHGVGESGFTGEIDGDDIFCFVIIERLRDEALKRGFI